MLAGALRAILFFGADASAAAIRRSRHHARVAQGPMGPGSNYVDSHMSAVR
jgi:hypothetical protein